MSALRRRSPARSPCGTDVPLNNALQGNTSTTYILSRLILQQSHIFKLVAEDVSVQVSFSPDAKRIVYGRENSPEAGKSQILIADATGRNEKVLATIPQAWFEHFCGWKNDKYGREKNPPQFLFRSRADDDGKAATTDTGLPVQLEKSTSPGLENSCA